MVGFDHQSYGDTSCLDNIEDFKLYMPSSLSPCTCHQFCQPSLLQMEECIQDAEAHDAIEDLWHHLHTWSHANKWKIANITGQIHNTCAREWQACIDDHVHCYDPTSWTQAQVPWSKLWSVSSTALVEPQRRWYITQGLWVIEGQEYTKDKRALIVAQRTCDEEILNYVSNLETVRTKIEGQRYISIVLRYQGKGSKRDLTRYSGIFE